MAALPIFSLIMLVHIHTGVVQLPSCLLLAWSGELLVWFRFFVHFKFRMCTTFQTTTGNTIWKNKSRINSALSDFSGNVLMNTYDHSVVTAVNEF